MREVRDPTLKLFGRAIPVPEAQGEAAEKPGSPAGSAAVEDKVRAALLLPVSSSPVFLFPWGERRKGAPEMGFPDPSKSCGMGFAEARRSSDCAGDTGGFWGGDLSFLLWRPPVLLEIWKLWLSLEIFIRGCRYG